MSFEVLLGSGLFVFALGVVFWAGAMYNRVLAIGNDVQEMKSLLAGFTRLEARVEEHDRRIGKLESGP